VNGVISSVPYGQSSTPSTLATSLTNAINSNANINSLVLASVSGTIVSITAKQTGSQTNYSLSAGAQSNDSTNFPDGTFFTATASGSAFTGGANAVYTTVYDTGTASITVNGSVASSYAYGQGDTFSSVAAGLASHFSSPYANASLNGNTVGLTAKTTGYSTNYPLSASISYNSGQFSGPSFTAAPSGSALTGGSDNTLYSLAVSSYAPNGDVLAANDSVNGNWTYSYDAFNRVVGANQNGGQSVYNYVYDIAGNRWQQNGP
jgi:YD repeat-containing protein